METRLEGKMSKRIEVVMIVFVMMAIVLSTLIGFAIGKNSNTNISTKQVDMIDINQKYELANKYLSYGNYKRALDLYREVEGYIDIGDGITIAVTQLDALGDKYFEECRYIDAMNYYKDAGSESKYEDAYLRALFEQAATHIEGGREYAMLGYSEMEDFLNVTNNYFVKFDTEKDLAQDYMKIAANRMSEYVD